MFQRTCALLMFLVLLPLVLVISIIQLLVFKKVVFKQSRTGYLGTSFYLYKFQTMYSSREDNGVLLSRWGRFLRKYSLDEILQLINVVKGEMNFVGPRPLLPKYWDLFSIEQKKRYNIKPGITGWAQVNGRNNLSWEKQFEMDVWYVENKSILLDFKIGALTLKRVFGSNESELKLRKPFEGNK